MSGADARFAPAGSAFHYDITTAENSVAAGQTMTFNGGGLGPLETLQFNGSAESDGAFRIEAEVLARLQAGAVDAGSAPARRPGHHETACFEGGHPAIVLRGLSGVDIDGRANLVAARGECLRLQLCSRGIGWLIEER